MKKTYSIAILAAMTSSLLLAEPIKYGPIKYALTPPPELDPITLDLTPPKSEWELRRERTKEMRKALRIDVAKREAFRYEARKRRLNRAAADILKVSEPSNAVVRVSVDYTSGDIRVEYADGYKIIQRYTPPKKEASAKSAVRHRPAIKEEGD